MKKPLRTFSIRLWLPLFAVSLIFIMTLLLAAYVYRAHDVELKNDSHDYAMKLVTDLSLLVNYMLANANDTNLQSTISRTALHDGVEYTLLVDNKLNILFASRLAWIGQNAETVLTAPRIATLKESFETSTAQIHKKNDQLFLAMNLRDPSGVKSSPSIVLSYDYHSKREELEKDFFNSFLPLLILNIFAGIIFLILGNRMLIRPLALLKDMSVKIKQLSPDLSSPLTGKSELAMVGEALAEAGEKIQHDIKNITDRENRLSITLNAIADGVIVTDEKGLIQRINPTACKITGWRKEEAKSKPVHTVFNATDASGEDVDPVGDVIRNKTQVELHNHTLLHDKTGKTHHIYETAAPILEDDNLIGVVLVFQDVSKEYFLRSKLRQNVQFLENILHISPSVTFTLRHTENSEQFQLSYISESITRYTGTSPETWLIHPDYWRSRIHPDDINKLRQGLFQALETPGKVISSEARFQIISNNYLYFQVNFVAHNDENMQLQIVGVAIDISEQKQTAKENVFLGAILENSLNEIYIFDQKTLNYIQVNFGARQNLGYSMEELSGLRPFDITRQSVSEFETLLTPLRQGKTNKVEFESQHYRKDGSHYPVSVSMELHTNTDHHVFVAFVDDQTQRKQSESEINFLAYHDQLTELPNRRLLDEQLNQTISHSHRKHETFALLYLDLDRFKVINDTLGHAAGDKLLTQAAKRIEQQLRAEDLVCRTGGDEFTIILTDTDSSGAVHVAQKILDTISEPFVVEKQTLHVTAAIGISMYPENGDSATVLQQKADNAMYRAKEVGRNHFQFFTEEMHDDMLHRMYLESQLHLAIERKELFLVYQPQLDIQHNKIIGAEALLRWKHARIGIISPAEFIPIAEDSGLIQKIGDWVLEEAITQTGQWKKTLKQPFTIAINLSAGQFRSSNLSDRITQLLATNDLHTGDIELEITESIAMQDINHTLNQMTSLSRAGIHLAMDDFGTGFSSLSSLKKFPINKLKIDKSFIDDMLTDKDDEAIVDAIITLAQTLGLSTIAEGVETQEQLDALKAKQCLSIQGYLFSKPIPADQILPLMEQHNHVT